MPMYTVNVEWSGYSRGVAAYEIEADSEEEAREMYYEGELLFSDTLRDDTESEVTSVETDDDE